MAWVVVVLGAVAFVAVASRLLAIPGPLDREPVGRLRVVGCTLGWDGRPTLALEDEAGNGGWIYPASVVRRDFARYFPDGFDSWPRDPATGEKLPNVHAR